jgi:hypothetical protein
MAVTQILVVNFKRDPGTREGLPIPATCTQIGDDVQNYFHLVATVDKTVGLDT